MKTAKLAIAALSGVVAGVVLEHPIRDGYNWVRGKLGLAVVPIQGAIAGAVKKWRAVPEARPKRRIVDQGEFEVIEGGNETDPHGPN